MGVNNSKKYSSKNSIFSKLKPQQLIVIYAAFIVIIICLIIVIVTNLSTVAVIGDGMDTSGMNVDKYSAEIKSQYDKEGQKDLFVAEYIKIQNAVGAYILNNSTMEDDSLQTIVKTLSTEINKDKSEKIGITKSTYWAGTWTILDDGKIAFKFESKKIEPSWINDSDVSSMTIKN